MRKPYEARGNTSFERQTHFRYIALQHKHFERGVPLPLADVSTIFNIDFVCTCGDMLQRLQPEHSSFLKFMSLKWKKQYAFPTVKYQNRQVGRILTGNTFKTLEKHRKHNVWKPNDMRKNMMTPKLKEVDNLHMSNHVTVCFYSSKNALNNF